MNKTTDPGTAGDGQGPVLAVVSDLFFVARIRETGRLGGVPVEFARTPEQIGASLAHRPRLALVDLTAGRVDIFFGNIAAALRFQKAGQAKFFGVASRTRSLVAPEVPTSAEAGYPELVSVTWFAVVAPPGTPEAVIRKVNADIAAALKLADVRAKFLDQGAEPQGQSPQATGQFIKEEESRCRAVIKSANVTLE